MYFWQMSADSAYFPKKEFYPTSDFLFTEEIWILKVETTVENIVYKFSFIFEKCQQNVTNKDSKKLTLLKFIICDIHLWETLAFHNVSHCTSYTDQFIYNWLCVV
ncbi:unnamed protein product [Trichobilharzia szidati]|nr:unnamed protein product [Trichobilharzia szidati]